MVTVGQQITEMAMRTSAMTMADAYWIRTSFCMSETRWLVSPKHEMTLLLEDGPFQTSSHSKLAKAFDATMERAAIADTRLTREKVLADLLNIKIFSNF